MSLAAARGITISTTVKNTRKSPFVTNDSSHGLIPRNILTTGGNSYLQIKRNEHIAPSV